MNADQMLVPEYSVLAALQGTFVLPRSRSRNGRFDASQCSGQEEGFAQGCYFSDFKNLEKCVSNMRKSISNILPGLHPERGTSTYMVMT